jgi:hypothetical protein
VGCKNNSVGSAGTRKELDAWAKGRRLMIASHFLWIGGDAMQKSQEGFLRSILWDILRQEPSLVELVLPDRWKNTVIASDLVSDRSPEPTSNWSLSELHAAFRRLPKVRKAHDFCFCIFVDGLDEYAGEKDEAIKIVQSLAAMTNIKICAASRPWNVFEEKLGARISENNQLRLQDLNAEAIRLYVKENLEDLEQFQLLKSRDPNASDISLEIVTNAKGVFLWVFLVVKSLVEGLRNFDRFMDLRNRLREFPDSKCSPFRLFLWTALILCIRS